LGFKISSHLKKILHIFFSFRLTGLILVSLGVSIAAATFIENDFGSETARAHIYNATWFELLFLVGIINLLGSMIIHRVFRKGKLTLLVFHLSFILILAGAAVTRYLGFTGIMHIREGQRSSTVISDEVYLRVQVLEGDATTAASRPVYLSGIRNRDRMLRVEAGNDPLTVEYLDHLNRARPTIRPAHGGSPSLLLVTSSAGGRDYHALLGKESKWIAGQLFHFNMEVEDGIRIMPEGDSLIFLSPYTVRLLSMTGQPGEDLAAGIWHPLQPMRVYTFGTISVVLSEYEPSGEVLAMRTSGDEGPGKTALSLRLKTGTASRNITLWGGKGMLGEPRQVSIGTKEVLLSYGSVARTLPFSLALNDFIMERYPGSDSPSSFESRVTLDDQQRGLTASHRIYMNHILDYRGYRFYQSSYDTDEKGTVLSVNRDRLGTSVTYTGYALLFLGLLMSLFNPFSRFRKLGSQLAEKVNPGKVAMVTGLVVMGCLSTGMPVRAQDLPDNQEKEIPASHARAFGELLVQDYQGRIKPMNTMASEVLRKVSRKTKINGLMPEQVLLGMMADPIRWQTIPMVKVSHPGIGEILKIRGQYASFLQFFDPHQEASYIIGEKVAEAHRKSASERSKFDTEILRVDERMNICYMVYSGNLLRILPDREDPDHTWHSPNTISSVYSGDDSLFAVNITQLYLEGVREGMETGNWQKADEYLGYLKIFQERMGAGIMPSSIRQKAEVFYNRLNIFDRLSDFYVATGIILLIIQLVTVLSPGKNPRLLRRIMVILLLAGFAVHTLGLSLRWYVSGHAPWSNGYESLLYISWATMLAGVAFSRWTATPLAATAVLAWMMLHTAHLSWMDPQVTNLVPVLKSYWLTIHVAVIASSYGFLGLACILGFLNLVLMGLQSRGNRDKVEQAIHSLSSVAEMTLIAGLGLLTIGTFLGGIWANESWGRYWAWDPKESWALITILVYAFIVHMRFIPGLKNLYAFNLAAVLGYASVIMTYFGVNYYLSGMHSYAKGDPVPVPTFVYYTLAVIALVAATAYARRKLTHNLN
jgi:cytochrome c-type biogenesis protein CcsB